jgi:hypothetical protein
MPLLPGNYRIFGATVFSTARIPPFEIAIGKAGIEPEGYDLGAGVGDGAGGVSARNAGAADPSGRKGPEVLQQ